MTGKRAVMRLSLLTSTYLHATHVVQSKISYQDMALNDDLRDAIEDLTAEGDTYTRLASSISLRFMDMRMLKRPCSLQWLEEPHAPFQMG